MSGEEEQPAGIFTRRFIVGTLVNLLLYINYYVLMVVMANYCMDTYAADLSTSGFAASIFIVGALVARFVSPPVIGTLGRKRTLVLGTLMMTALSAAYLFNAGIVALFAVRVLHGFFYGLAQTTVTSLTTESIPDAHKGEGIGYYMLSVTVGSAIGPFLGTALMHGPGFTVMFALCAMVAAIALAGATSIRGASARDNAAAKDRHTTGTLHLTGNTTSEDNGTQHESIPYDDALHDDARNPRTSSPATTKRGFALSTFIERTALPISSVVVLVYLGYGAVITYLNAFAAEAGFTTAAGFFFVAYALTMLVSRPFTGKAFDRRGDLPVMTSGFAAFVMGMLLIGAATNGAFLLVGACLMGYGIGTIQPSGLTLCVRRAPDDRFDVANSTFFVFLDAAIGLCPILFGWTVPLIGYRGLFILLGSVAALAFALYLALRARKLIG